MAKIIKKSFKYFIIIIAIIIIIPTLLYLLLQVSDIQTFLVKRITSHFSDEIKSTISVGKVEYKFFNKLSINDLLIKDKNNDTLIYSQKVTAGFRKIDLKNRIFRLGRIILIKPVIALNTDSSGAMNLTWYLDMIKTSSDTASKVKSTFSIEQIDISNARFSLINRYGVKGVTKIDFNNLNISTLNGIIEDFKTIDDTTSFNIYNLGFKESSGFIVKKLNSSIKFSHQNFFLSSVFLDLDSSVINIAKFTLKADSSASFKRFAQEVKLDILLEKSLINTSDLQYFLPFMKGINESVWLSGKVLGTVSELRGRDIELYYRDLTYIGCDFDLSGLPNIENAFIYIGVNNLKTNVKDIEKINVAGKGFIILPEILHKLGNISFDGSFTGFITDFVTYGEIRSTLGNIRTDLSLRPEESKKYHMNGLLTGSEIDLGELTGNKEMLGKVSFQTNINGYAINLKKFAANLTGNIDSIEIKNYKYRNVKLNGSFTEKTWDGSVSIFDENIKLDLLGMFSFKEKDRCIISRLDILSS